MRGCTHQKDQAMTLTKTLAPVLLALAGCSTAAQAASYTMLRDPGCGCCEQWAGQMRTGLHADITTADRVSADRTGPAAAVPAPLRACHTMMVDGYVIEGHVPAAAIARLLKERPAGIAGLAVAGMPAGSPGMEMGGRTEPYDVIAFGPAGERVFQHISG